MKTLGRNKNNQLHEAATNTNNKQVIAVVSLLLFLGVASYNLLTLNNFLTVYINSDLLSGSASDNSSQPAAVLPSLDNTNNNNNVDPNNDFVWSRYCKKGQSPCIALLSAAHRGGITSKVDPKNPVNKRQPSESEVLVGAENQARRILMRQGYCAMHGCDVIIDYNNYSKNRTMWLSDHGKHKVGQMPPHWNKVAALKRWLPHFDGIVQMDMDTTWVDFNTSIYDLYNSTSSIYFNGGVGLIMVKRMDISHCIVDSWWYHGTSRE